MSFPFVLLPDRMISPMTSMRSGFVGSSRFGRPRPIGRRWSGASGGQIRHRVDGRRRIKPPSRISGTRPHECPKRHISPHIRAYSGLEPSAAPMRNPCKRPHSRREAFGDWPKLPCRRSRVRIPSAAPRESPACGRLGSARSPKPNGLVPRMAPMRGDWQRFGSFRLAGVGSSVATSAHPVARRGVHRISTEQPQQLLAVRPWYLQALVLARQLEDALGHPVLREGLTQRR